MFPREIRAAGPVAVASALLTAIGAVRRTARRAVQQAWDQEPLPPARSELLRLVARRPGITVAEAAHELHLAQNTISTLVSKLAAEHLLDRGTDTADRRAVRLTVAPAGRARLAGYRDLRAELAGRALSAADNGRPAGAGRRGARAARLAGQLEAAVSAPADRAAPPAAATGVAAPVAAVTPAVLCAGADLPVRHAYRGDRARPGDRARGDVRPARAERGGQDHHDPDAHHAAEADGGQRGRVRGQTPRPSR